VPVTDQTAATRRAVLRTAASVSIATGAYGVSFGALATASGLSVLQACTLSLLTFTGGSQFALVGALAGGAGAASATAPALLLGVRNLFYGARLHALLDVRGWRRPAAAHLVIDESTAVALRHEADGRPAARLGFWATGLGVFALWNLFTLAGALAGAQLADPRDLGLDAAVPAAFVALLVPRLRDRLTWAVAAVAVVVALALVPVTPVGVPVLAAGVVALVALRWQR